MSKIHFPVLWTCTPYFHSPSSSGKEDVCRCLDSHHKHVPLSCCTNFPCQVPAVAHQLGSLITTSTSPPHCSSSVSPKVFTRVLWLLGQPSPTATGSTVMLYQLPLPSSYSGPSITLIRESKYRKPSALHFICIAKGLHQIFVTAWTAITNRFDCPAVLASLAKCMLRFIQHRV